jgi:hypothetical protein
MVGKVFLKLKYRTFKYKHVPLLRFFIIQICGKLFVNIIFIFSQNLVHYRPSNQPSPCPPLYTPTYAMEGTAASSASCIKEEQHNAA